MPFLTVRARAYLSHEIRMGGTARTAEMSRGESSFDAEFLIGASSSLVGIRFFTGKSIVL